MPSGFAAGLNIHTRLQLCLNNCFMRDSSVKNSQIHTQALLCMMCIMCMSVHVLYICIYTAYVIMNVPTINRQLLRNVSTVEAPPIQHNIQSHSHTDRRACVTKKYRKREQQKQSKKANIHNTLAKETWGIERHDGCRKKLIIIVTHSGGLLFLFFIFVIIHFLSVIQL